MSLLKPLIVMQLIPEQAEKKSDGESNHRSDDDENGGYGKAKWLDHINRSNEMHPEHKIDQRLGPTNSNQERPAKMPDAKQRSKGHTDLNWIDHLQNVLLEVN